MPWYDAGGVFFGGAFLANFVPHCVSGVSGRSFYSPFAKPPVACACSRARAFFASSLKGCSGVGPARKVQILPGERTSATPSPPPPPSARFETADPAPLIASQRAASLTAPPIRSESHRASGPRPPHDLHQRLDSKPATQRR